MLYFITSNDRKFHEAHLIIPELQRLDISLDEIQEFDAHKIVEHKLSEARKHHDGAFVVEDTSFSLDALGGLPGPFAVWFLKQLGAEKLSEIAIKLGNTKSSTTTLIGYSTGNGDIKFFEGTVNGTITKPRGEHKFGFDPIFQPEGYSQTFGEMSREEKNKISQRGIAFTKLKEFLNTV